MNAEKIKNIIRHSGSTAKFGQSAGGLVRRYLRDPIHGEIVLEDDEYRLINTVEFQRLRRLLQLHQVHLVYDGATHTRFAHSLGTLGAVQRILRESVRLNLKPEEKKPLRIAALLHDIGHSCFAHVLEPYFSKKKDAVSPQMDPHEKITIRILEDGLDDWWEEHGGISATETNRARFVHDELKGQLRRDVVSILKGEVPALSPLVSGHLDADHLDYIRRDSHYLGLPEATYDQAIFGAYMHEVRDRERVLVFRKNRVVVSAIEGVIQSRWYLFRHAYLHHAVMAANAMLIEALANVLGGSAWKSLYVLGDYELLRAIATKDGPLVSEAKAKDVAANLGQRLLTRRLYKRCYGAYVLPESPQEKRLEVLKHSQTKRTDFVSAMEKAARKVNQQQAGDVLLGWPLAPGDKPYGEIMIQGGSRLEDETDLLPEKTLKGHLERYHQLRFLYVFSANSNQEERQAIHDAAVNEFGPATLFDPRRERISEPLEFEIAGAVRAIRLVDPKAIEVVRLLAEYEELEQQRIGTLLGKDKGPTSTLMNGIRQALSSEGAESILQVVEKPRPGRGRPRKVWRIPDESHRRLLLEEIKNE